MSDTEIALLRMVNRIERCETLLRALLWIMVLLAVGGFLFQIATLRTVTRIKESLQCVTMVQVESAKAGDE